MLGQYRILSEVLIFAVGMAIASYVTLSYSNVRDFIGTVSTEDKLQNIAYKIINALVKASSDNSYLVIEIPEKVSEKDYRIRAIKGDRSSCLKGQDCFLNLSTNDISISRQLFNISQNYIIKGDVTMARFLTIRSDKGMEQIVIGRE